MRSRILLGAAASVIALAACGSDDSVTVKSTTYKSTMNSASEVPAKVSSATGTAIYTLTGRTITYTVVVDAGTSLTGPATVSHIHIGSAAVAGPVIFPFTASNVATGTIATGTINLDLPVTNGTASTMSGDSLLVLFNTGNAYTNIHTTANGGGEIRGQIIKQP